MRARPGARQALRFLLGILLLSGAASAQQPRTLTTYSAEPIGQVILPNVDPPDGRERTVGNGDIVLESRIGFRALAAVAEPIELVIADRPVRVTPGEMLLEMRVRGGPMATLPAARAFCLPSSETSNGNAGRSRDDQMACFVDQDNDGKLDFALLTGKHERDARVTVPLNALAYGVRSDVPMPGAEIRIVYQGKPVLGPTALAIALDPGIAADSILEMRWRGEDGRMHGITRDRPVKQRSYPHIVNFGSARIEILAYDQEARQVRLRVLQGFARTDLEIVLGTRGR